MYVLQYICTFLYFGINGIVNCLESDLNKLDHRLSHSKK